MGITLAKPRTELDFLIYAKLKDRADDLQGRIIPLETAAGKYNSLLHPNGTTLRQGKARFYGKLWDIKALRSQYAHVLDAKRKLNRELRPLLRAKKVLDDALREASHEPLHDSLGTLVTEHRLPDTVILSYQRQRERGHYWAGNVI